MIEQRDIIVIGMSMGGFAALKTLVRNLPADLKAAIFVVWHMPPDALGVLPDVLNREGSLFAANAVDRELIKPGRIYVAPPDHHLLVEKECLRVTKGPKENRFRPAVDPLFRSAAYAHGARVVGVVLSGALDDGTAGLWTIKHRGGIAIVQDPQDAEVPSMPQNALNQVEVDYCVPIAEMSELLISLAQEAAASITEVSMEENQKTELEIRVPAEDGAFESGIMSMGELSPLTCPECHGVFLRFKDGNIVRFRCHTGHAYSSDTLLATITEKIEDSTWSAIRAVEESIMLLSEMSENLSKSNKPDLAALYSQKAQEAEQRAQIMRQAVMQNERLSNSNLSQQSEGNDSNDTSL